MLLSQPQPQPGPSISISISHPRRHQLRPYNKPLPPRRCCYSPRPIPGLAPSMPPPFATKQSSLFLRQTPSPRVRLICSPGWICTPRRKASAGAHSCTCSATATLTCDERAWPAPHCSPFFTSCHSCPSWTYIYPSLRIPSSFFLPSFFPSRRQKLSGLLLLSHHIRSPHQAGWLSFPAPGQPDRSTARLHKRARGPAVRFGLGIGAKKKVVIRFHPGPSLSRRDVWTNFCAEARDFLRRLAAMSTSELACTYAALILHDDGISITADKIATLLKAANVSVESYWPALFAKLLEKRSVEDLITNVGSGGGGGAAVSAGGAAPAAAAAPAAEKVEEKKEEPKEESDDDMGFSLFD